MSQAWTGKYLRRLKPQAQSTWKQPWTGHKEVNLSIHQTAQCLRELPVSQEKEAISAIRSSSSTQIPFCDPTTPTRQEATSKTLFHTLSKVMLRDKNQQKGGSSQTILAKSSLRQKPRTKRLLNLWYHSDASPKTSSKCEATSTSINSKSQSLSQTTLWTKLANRNSPWKTPPTEQAPLKRASTHHHQSHISHQNKLNSRSFPGRTTSGPMSASRRCRSRWSRAGLESRSRTRPRPKMATVKNQIIWSSMKLLRAHPEMKMKNVYSSRRHWVSRIKTKKWPHHVKKSKSELNAWNEKRGK